MPASNHTGLPLKVLHFDAKNHVAFNPLVVKGCTLAWVQAFESNVHIFHFFGNGVCPQGVAALSSSRAWSTKVGTKVAHFLLLKKENDAFAEPQNLWNPPVECRLVVNALRNGIFSHL